MDALAAAAAAAALLLMTQQRPFECTACKRAFTRKSDMKHHTLNYCKVLKGGRRGSKMIGCPIGSHTVGGPITNMGFNFKKHCFGSRAPCPGIKRKMLEWLERTTSTLPRSRTEQDGAYSKSSLSLSQTNELLKLYHAQIPGLDELLETWGVKRIHPDQRLIPDGVVIFHCDENAPVGQTTEPHSDSGPVVFIQLIGQKQLRIGGIHIPPAGSSGSSMLLTGDALEKFDAESKGQIIDPGNVAGFEKRQTHHLTTLSSPNLSMSIPVQPLTV
jgi:hypothetical protein